MPLARVYTRAIAGVDAPQVSVEVDISGGLPAFNLVGLPETAVRESRDRVRAAILNAGFEFPQRRITVSLAPADLPKEGGRFDLPIALGVLAASSQVPNEGFDATEFSGELSLGGALRAVPGALPCVIAAATCGRAVVLPRAVGEEAALVEGADVRVADCLLDVVRWLRALESLDAPSEIAVGRQHFPDLRDVRGQHGARRALEIAAAGGHNLLFCGPPGSGKSMLASRLPGILPTLTQDRALESAAIHSVSTLGFDVSQWRQPPFRHPHHTVSGVALVGGGALAQPGEASLAHGGVLFLDELAEFPRAVLDVLREPLETREIHISRARRRARYPASFQLIAAMNPCPCGYFGDTARACRCSAEQIQRYQSRVSGPLLDRIDLHITVPPVEYTSQQRELLGESSAAVGARVQAAREHQMARQDCLNADLNVSELHARCALCAEGEQFFAGAASQLKLSMRACHRVLKVARTIADLGGEAAVGLGSLSEAIGLRR